MDKNICWHPLGSYNISISSLITLCLNCFHHDCHDKLNDAVFLVFLLGSLKSLRPVDIYFAQRIVIGDVYIFLSLLKAKPLHQPMLIHKWPTRYNSEESHIFFQVCEPGNVVCRCLPYHLKEESVDNWWSPYMHLHTGIMADINACRSVVSPAWKLQRCAV